MCIVGVSCSTDRRPVAIERGKPKNPTKPTTARGGLFEANNAEFAHVRQLLGDFLKQEFATQTKRHGLPRGGKGRGGAGLERGNLIVALISVAVEPVLFVPPACALACELIPVFPTSPQFPKWDFLRLGRMRSWEYSPTGGSYSSLVDWQEPVESQQPPENGPHASSSEGGS